MIELQYNPVLLKKNILLLQGPTGPFFKKFSRFLTSKEVTVFKINFHLGEQLFFYGKNTTLYKGDINSWPNYLYNFLVQHDIKQVFCLGKEKIYHKLALKLCLTNNVDFFIFEEGYIRPYFITLQQITSDSNSQLGNSSLLDFKPLTEPNPNNKQEKLSQLKWLDKILLGYRRYLKWQCHLLYGYGLALSQFYIPHYQHHIPFKGVSNFIKWHNVALRTFASEYTPYINVTNNHWSRKNKNKYYLLALQINTDSAVVYDNTINNMYDLIKKVMLSFARFAPENEFLLIKHHPLDKGWNSYGAFIKSLALQLQIKKRVKYVYNIDCLTSLKNAKGCIVLNSTLGLTALQHGVPTIALSKDAFYNYKGLTFQNGLDDFWKNLTPVNAALFNLIYNNLIYDSQIKGSFYAGTPELEKKFQIRNNTISVGNELI